jgi:MFS family permease
MVGAFWSAASPTLRRNLLLDLTAASGVGITMALVSSLLPTVARMQGLDPLGLAMLAAAPFAANLLGVFAGRFGPRSPRQLALFRSSGAALLLVIVLAPVPVVLAAVAVGFWISVAFSIPFQHRLWGAMYPSRERGRLIGIVATGRAATVGIAALVGGLLADRIGGMAVVGLAGAVGAACAWSSSRIRAVEAAQAQPFSARASWRAFRDRPALRRIGYAQLFYGGGMIAAAPLFPLVHADRLGLSLADVGVLGILTAISATASCLFWGGLADRRGGLAPIRIGAALAVAALLGYTVAPSVAALWASAVLLGLANAAMEMGWPSMLAEHTPLEDRAAAAAGLNALTGARGLVMPFMGTALVQLGMIEVGTALLLCAVCTGVGVVLYARLGTDGEPRPWSALSHPRTMERGMRRARQLLVRPGPAG